MSYWNEVHYSIGMRNVGDASPLPLLKSLLETFQIGPNLSFV